VSREQHAGAAAAVDAFLRCWSEADAARRREALVAVASPDVTFADAFSCTSGIDDLVAHLGAAQVHMPGMVLERSGDVRQCQGTVLADWVAKGPDGAARGRGTNVLELTPDSRIARVVGFWASAQ
jgi:SnoaL-like protein